MAYLANDIEPAQQYLEDLKANNTQIKNRPDEVSSLKKYLNGNESRYHDEYTLKALHKALDNTGQRSYPGSISLPDLVSLMPQEEAEALIRKLFTKRISINHIYDTEETLALAQRIAAEMRDELTMPYWCLVTGTPDGEKLYHSFMKRFPPFKETPDAEADEDDTSSSWENDRLIRDVRKAALSVAVFKVGKGQMDEAIEIMLPFVPSVMKKFTEDGKVWSLSEGWRHRKDALPAKTGYDFYMRLLAKVPEFPVGTEFIKLGIACGQASAVEQHLTERLKDATLTPAHRRALQEAYATLLLATDRVQEALALRGSILADALKTQPSGKTKSRQDDWLGYALVTAEIAAQVKDVPALQASLNVIPALWKRVMADRSSGSLSLAEMIKLFEEGGRANEVEPLLIDALAREQGNEDDYSSDTLNPLLAFYARHHRMADIITLLEDAPWWGEARDVLQVEDRGRDREGLDASVAHAFYETGRVAEAQKLLTEIMMRYHSVDWTYELLLKMAGDDLNGFIALMDTLYARDAFEERPLIWKAEALRRLKRLEEAEQVIRAALKVDPTDGEQPDGDRVRAYNVLADILADRGKAEDAKFFKDVVEAVRVAEEGDVLANLGLDQRSMDYFAKAETLFADAYCVQWRLAERMREMGKTEEAQKHYAIAFERMPEQFGQVASLCFGCMGVFENADSICAAERVLTRLAETPPVRPPVYYLLGQLRETQKRYDEAYGWYRKALDADPGYLDVMKNLYGMKRKVKRPAQEWVDLQTQMFRLDPLGYHSGRHDHILDWASFWTIRNDALKALPKPLETLFPLTANIKRLEAKKTGEEERDSCFGSYHGSYHDRTGNQTAAEVLVQSRVVLTLSQMNQQLVPETPEPTDEEDDDEGDGERDGDDEK